MSKGKKNLPLTPKQLKQATDGSVHITGSGKTPEGADFCSGTYDNTVGEKALKACAAKFGWNLTTAPAGHGGSFRIAQVGTAPSPTPQTYKAT